MNNHIVFNINTFHFLFLACSHTYPFLNCYAIDPVHFWPIAVYLLLSSSSSSASSFSFISKKTGAIPTGHYLILYKRKKKRKKKVLLFFIVRLRFFLSQTLTEVCMHFTFFVFFLHDFFRLLWCKGDFC